MAFRTSEGALKVLPAMLWAECYDASIKHRNKAGTHPLGGAHASRGRLYCRDPLQRTVDGTIWQSGTPKVTTDKTAIWSIEGNGRQDGIE
jgi:hypothetical protein